MNTEAEKKDIETNSDVAAFSYFLILSWVILYTRKDSPYIQFHARQASLLFVVAIIIALLPPNFSFLNLFTLGLAVAGFFQANLGRRWKMPIIAHLLDSGVSVDMAWKTIIRIVQTLKNSFRTSGGSQSDQMNSKTDSADSDLQRIVSKQEDFINLQMEKIDFLEQELLIEKYLTKATKSRLDKEIESEIDKLTEALSALFKKEKVSPRETKSYILLEDKSGHKIFVGGFENDSCTVFLSEAVADAELAFGRYHGFVCDLTDKKSIKKVLDACTAALA